MRQPKARPYSPAAKRANQRPPPLGRRKAEAAQPQTPAPPQTAPRPFGQQNAVSPCWGTPVGRFSMASPSAAGAPSGPRGADELTFPAVNTRTARLLPAACIRPTRPSGSGADVLPGQQSEESVHGTRNCVSFAGRISTPRIGHMATNGGSAHDADRACSRGPGASPDFPQDPRRLGEVACFTAGWCDIVGAMCARDGSRTGPLSGGCPVERPEFTAEQRRSLSSPPLPSRVSE